MRIRNNRPYAIYLPYAGTNDKGWRVEKGKLSPEVPAKRFYDPLLQAHWRAGSIDLILTTADKAILGDAVVGLAEERVTIKESGKDAPATLVEHTGVPVEPAEPVPPVRDKVSRIPLPIARDKVSQSVIGLPDTHTVAVGPVTVNEVTPAADTLDDAEPAAPDADDTETLADAGDVDEAAEDTAPIIDAGVALQAEQLEADAPKPPEGNPDRKNLEGVHCSKCGGTSQVRLDRRVGGVPLCKFCRMVLTRSVRKTGIIHEPVPPPEPAPVPDRPTEGCPHAVPAETGPSRPTDVAAPGIVDQPFNEGPEFARSLADLQRLNKRVSYAPKFGEESSKADALPDHGDPLPPASHRDVPSLQGVRTVRIERFMRDIKPKTGSSLGRLE
jgi:hypothetical protein